MHSKRVIHGAQGLGKRWHISAHNAEWLFQMMMADRSPGFLIVRTSNVLSMEKLPLLVHGYAITDQRGDDNVGTEERLR